MSSSNPYTPPFSDSDSRPISSAGRKVHWAGVFISGFIGIAYCLVACISIYEYVCAADHRFTIDYVRTGIASAVFALLSFAATISLLRRHQTAKWLLLVSPTLLVVFVYPGLNTIWNFVTRVVPF